MSKKTVLLVILALVVGIGGTVAFFQLHALFTAHTAPPIPPAQTAGRTASTPAAPAVPPQTAPAAQQNASAAAPPTPQPGAQAAQPLQQNAPAPASITRDQLVLAQISYGAPIDVVRQTYGEPYEIDHDDDGFRGAAATVYEYAGRFDLYVVNGIVERVKVDDLNGLGTAAGIKVGSSAEDVVAAYGTPTVVEGDHYIYRTADNPAVGLDFELKYRFVEEIKCGVLSR